MPTRSAGRSESLGDRAEIELESRGSWRSTLKVALLCGAVYSTLAIVATGVFAPYRFLMGDCTYYYAFGQSLLEDGDLILENNLSGGLEAHATQISLGADGNWRPKHPILMAVASLPFLAAFGPHGLLAFNVLVLVLLSALTHRIATRGADSLSAAWATLLTCLASFIALYSYNYSPDAFAALPALLAALYLIDGRAFPSGFAAGIAVLGKPVHALSALVCGLLVLLRYGWRAAFRFALGTLPAAIALLAYNHLLFGNPITFSYDRMIAKDGTIFTQRSDFSLSMIPSALPGQLFDLQHGLVFSAPPVVVACIGLVYLWRRDRFLSAVPLSLMVAYVGLFSTYRHWDTSYIGNRFLFHVILLSALPLAAYLGVDPKKVVDE